MHRPALVLVCANVHLQKTAAGNITVQLLPFRQKSTCAPILSILVMSRISCTCDTVTWKRKRLNVTAKVRMGGNTGGTVGAAIWREFFFFLLFF